MNKLKFLVSITLAFILSSTVFAQVEKTVTETKVKVEKVVDKAANEMGKDVKETKMCGPDSKKACCTADAKEMKSDMKKHAEDCKCEGCDTKTETVGKVNKMMNKAHSKDCDCEGCSTASAGMHDGHEMMKKAHAADCDCEGCKVAKVEMKDHKHKAHAKDCSCKSCAKT